MAKVVLRPYQVEAIEAIKRERAAGVMRQLVVMATGAGKTEVFARLLPEARGKRTLIVAHREELLTQAKDKLLRANPGTHISIEQAGRHASRFSSVVIASVPTIGRKDSPRLKAMKREEFGLVIVDEAHHAAAVSYKTVLDNFGILDGHSAAPLLVGFTATPERGDGVGLSTIFQKVVFEKNIIDLIEMGYLAPIRAWRVKTDALLDGVKIRAGDFVESELADAVNTPERNELAVQAFRARDAGQGKKGLVFCVDVQHVKDMTKAFRAYNIAAEMVTGETPKDERRAILRRFAEGGVQVAVNCMCLTEGFDEPSIQVVVMARPTKSRSLFLQCLGRGTRLHPGKEALEVVDMADVTKHGVASAAEIFGLDPKWESEGEDLRTAAKKVTEMAFEQPAVRGAVSLDDARRLMREINIMGDAAIRQEIAVASSMSWIQLPNGMMYLALPGQRRLTATGDMLDQWTVKMFEGDRCVGIVGDDATCSDTWGSREEAVWAADSYVRRAIPDVVRVVDTNMRWRGAKASEAQQYKIKRLGGTIHDKMTKGEASDLITILEGRRRAS